MMCAVHRWYATWKVSLPSRSTVSPSSLWLASITASHLPHVCWRSSRTTLWKMVGIRSLVIVPFVQSEFWLFEWSLYCCKLRIQHTRSCGCVIHWQACRWSSQWSCSRLSCWKRKMLRSCRLCLRRRALRVASWWVRVVLVVMAMRI